MKGWTKVIPLLHRERLQKWKNGGKKVHNRRFSVFVGGVNSRFFLKWNAREKKWNEFSVPLTFIIKLLRLKGAAVRRGKMRNKRKGFSCVVVIQAQIIRNRVSFRRHYIYSILWLVISTSKGPLKLFFSHFFFFSLVLIHACTYERPCRRAVKCSILIAANVEIQTPMSNLRMCISGLFDDLLALRFFFS